MPSPRRSTASGGEILSFLGDGFLALFPCERHGVFGGGVPRGAERRNEGDGADGRLNTRRRNEGLEEIGFGIGLHVGNVMFGNVGLTDRLTFSVFGSAVNEVQRLQS